MSDQHHHVCYADRAWHGTVTLEENSPLAHDTYRLRFCCAPVARQIVPGQFLMVRLAGCQDPLLGRALALYNVLADADGRPQQIEVVYLTVGKMTQRLASLEPGATVEIWGPLGNGFPPTPAEHLVMVAGGIGQTPMLALAQERLGLRCFGDPPRQAPLAKKVTLCYGARRADYLAGVEDFRQLGVEVRISTDDGSAGHHGLVTDLIRPVVQQSPLACRIACCGPEPMMAATAAVARELSVPCQVSLETPMACGIGICFSCVAKIRDCAGGWDYRRTCVEGPVFDAEQVEF